MKPKNKPYWIVFYGDNGSREDCSVYYSWLVRADTKGQAIARVVKEQGEGNFEAEEMALLEA